eukprot:CAMPEP_0113582444 /NCGR_PEP_ID=MMETSP0015_2-20120614/31920_1 /TAXON_ID=2838 /ORGANISM="Odontella" /LENGTH=618 /DNA_ID=CAMNT_0000487121 /DNA_START=645 /DNA_END=2501 /DNA_ORIENTATION=- /assembly_acc=CAM_ASM_000160
MALGFSLVGFRHWSEGASINGKRHCCSSPWPVSSADWIQTKMRTCLCMEMNGGEKSDEEDKDSDISSGSKGGSNSRRKKKRPSQSKRVGPGRSNSTRAQGKRHRGKGGRGGMKSDGKISIPGLLHRVTQLETLVASQTVEIRKLREECRDLSEAAVAFGQVVELLRQAGFSMENYEGNIASQKPAKQDKSTKPSQDGDDKEKKKEAELKTPSIQDIPGGMSAGDGLYYEYYDDEEIFGSAPASVIDAADSAGASILAAMLAGKQRMLVDVRDAELTRDPDILVQFIELAILPVAAGLEGLKSERNRVKIVFPTVSQLLQYRRTMALSAPEVVALSTLGFEPVAKTDNLVVIIAPSPDDPEGLEAMNELLQPSISEREMRSNITQPVVVLNHHMVPVSGPAATFEVAYHLRLLSVQYMTGDMTLDYVRYLEEEKQKRKAIENENEEVSAESQSTEKSKKDARFIGHNEKDDKDEESLTSEEEDALEAAMNHASELGVNHGITRAMVIRAYPRPWHVFVDTSPDTDADFEVAATFDEEPSQDDVNYAIVECLEGSEREDELVAQQMQAALESGQLNRVSEMLGLAPDVEIDEDDDQSIDKKKNQEDEDDDDFNYFNEDSL